LLEEFYAAMGRENGRRLYYERRSKQYASLPIKASDIVTLPVQAKAFLGTFLEEPHSTHRYYGEILSTNRSRIFREGHSAYPYYVAAYGWKRMQQALARGEVERRYKPYLFHLLLLIRKASGGDKVPALSGKDIDEYCKKVFAVLSDDGRFGEAVANAQATLDRAIGSFIGDRRLMPRLRAFTASLVPAMRERPRGKVAYYNIDRGFGFVQLLGDGKAHDVFVHHSDLSGMDRLTHRYLEKGETVELDVVDTDRGPQGRDVRLIDTEQAAEPSVSSR
jgi:cold shock CspA family protein